MTVFFTSDHHFGDARRLGIDRRPFGSADEMDRAMIDRWNEVVGRDDEVWHLGDLTRWTDRGRVDALLGVLHGRKHLIVGNNDGAATTESRLWASVAHYAEIEAEGVRLVLCHYPFRTWNGMGKSGPARSRNLHGHSHGRLTPISAQHDVGVDVRGFRPVRLAEIRLGRRPSRV